MDKIQAGAVEMLFVNALFSGSTHSHFWSLTADTLLATSQATNTDSHLISSSHSHLSLLDLYARGTALRPDDGARARLGEVAVINDGE
jgi:hypothetical protein